MRELLPILCRLKGVSGFEDAVREYIRAYAAPHATSIEEDAAGNLLVYKKGTAPSGRSLMVAAHMDEVGFVVKAINEDGTLQFAPVGGIVSKILPGTGVLVGDKALPGVIGMTPPHFKGEKMPGAGDLVIDIGAGSRKAAEGYTYPGDYVVFAGEPCFFGEDSFKARAVDDRLGCAVMLKLLPEDMPCDICYCFTVQEEIGSGAVTAAYRVKPDAALVLECTTAADLPFVKGALRTSRFGKGAAIPTADGGTLYNADLVKKARALADEAGIPWQDKTTIAGGTDARAISQSGYGVPTVAISAPGRYLHSAISCVKWSDVIAVYDAARLFVQNFR